MQLSNLWAGMYVKRASLDPGPRIFVQIAIYRRLRIGRDLDQSEANDIIVTCTRIRAMALTLPAGIPTC